MEHSAPTRWILIFTIAMAKLSAAWVGNPAQPILQDSGIIRSAPNWWSFRLSYVGDYVYRQRFHDEFRIAGSTETPTYIKLRTQAAMLTLNFRDRVDFYGIAGGTCLKVDHDVETDQQFCWGVGGKLIILHEGNFRIGIDVKYFQTDQTPQYFKSEGYAFNIVSDFHFSYSEIQAAMGVSYRTKYVSPYINATYLISKLEPDPMIALVRFPFFDEIADVVTKSVIGNRRWGMALGATLIDSRKASFNIEWRAFNQNSIDASLEVRF